MVFFLIWYFNSLIWQQQTTDRSLYHYNGVIMGILASQITSLKIVYSIVYSGGTDQRKHHSFASLVFVPGIHRWPVNSPHKWQVTLKKFPLDDIIMCCLLGFTCSAFDLKKRKIMRHRIYLIRWTINGDQENSRNCGSDTDLTCKILLILEHVIT